MVRMNRLKNTVIATLECFNRGEAIQAKPTLRTPLDCHAALAMTTKETP